MGLRLLAKAEQVMQKQPPKRRNPVAKNAGINRGGAHKDKKREALFRRRKIRADKLPPESD